MSDQKLCASCMNFSIDKILKSQPTQKPSWLSKTDYVEEFIHKQTNFDLKKPSKYDVVMNLELGKSNANKNIATITPTTTQAFLMLYITINFLKGFLVNTFTNTIYGMHPKKRIHDLVCQDLETWA